MDPRISFSNDFVDTQQSMKLENIYREAPVSSDFEFTVKDRCMKPADEIFFQGMLLPLKGGCSHQLVKTTLRDELEVNDDDDDLFPKLTKTSGCWKERFGFKRSHVVPKKQHKSEGILQTVEEEEEKTTIFLHEDLLNIARKNGYDDSELLLEEEIICRDERNQKAMAASIERLSKTIKNYLRSVLISSSVVSLERPYW